MHHLKAVAATHYGKQRDEAEKVKRGIRKQTRIQSVCPYCGTRLRIEEAHADHIYPVKKGGLSTLENMVYVCHSCNGKKRDMVLRDFIKGFALNREEIEGRLEKLKKKF
ncbi:MAG: HNH endonuclease [Nitrososphaera sp.]